MPKACLTKGETTMDYIRWIREKVGHEKIMLNFVSGCLRDKQGKLLLQKRADKNLWGFPDGAIELGESFEEALIREYLEETGLCVKVTSLIGIYSKYEDSYPNGDRAQPISFFFKLEYVSGNYLLGMRRLLNLDTLKKMRYLN